MPGLNLRASVAARAGGGGLYPVPATATPSAPSTAAVAAYGPLTGADGSRGLAAIGAGTAGVVAALLMLYIWWSLPR